MLGERAISGSLSTSMSLNTFQFEAKRRWKILKEEELALAEAHTLFAKRKEIWPDQCNSILTVLCRIENPVRELRTMLETPEKLPTSVIQHRHLLLMAIQHTDEQIQELISLITEFHMLCQAPSKQATMLRQEIERGLEVLLSECDEVVNSIHSLSDQARFQEKKATSPDHQRVELLRDAYLYERQGNVYSKLGKKESAREFLEEALRLIHKLGDHRGESRILNDLGRICSVSGKKWEALDYLEKALVVVREGGDHQQEGKVLNNLGLVNLDLGWREEAREYLEDALKLVRKIEDRKQEGRIQNTLGLIFDDLGQKEQAKTCFERALQIRREQHDHQGEGITLNNLGWVYDNLGRKDQARQCFEDALSIFREEVDRWGEGKTLNNLGQVYVDLGEYEKALSFHQQALASLKEVGDRWEEGRTLNNLVHVYNNLGLENHAYECYKEALKISREVGDCRGEGWTLHNIGLLFLQENRYEQSLASLLLAKQRFEDVQSPDSEKAVKCIEDLYNLVGKDKFHVLLQDVEPRAPQIVEQTLRRGTG